MSRHYLAANLSEWTLSQGEEGGGVMEVIRGVGWQGKGGEGGTVRQEKGKGGGAGKQGRWEVGGKG